LGVDIDITPSSYSGRAMEPCAMVGKIPSPLAGKYAIFGNRCHG